MGPASKSERRERIDPNLSAGCPRQHWRLLRAQTSCNFFWGEAWLPRCHADLDETWAILHSLKGE